MSAAAALLLAVAAPTARCDGGAPVGLTVAIEGGEIRGISVGGEGGVAAFLGIPFAAPPTGALRFRPPEPVEPWEGVRECVRFGPSCPQPVSAMSAAGGGAGEQSEDCLHLNVWTAAKRDDERRPVMVWIHGGAFFLGSASGTSYDGANLARRGVVVVTVNYRLGPFGFLAHPELSKESPHGASGNWGLLDQIAALRWVKSNVARLGGDPGNVTIFGESAGAMSVSCLLVSPLARGLFHRAIAQSGAAIWMARRLREPGLQEESAEAAGVRVVQDLVGEAKDPIAAARAKSAQELLAAARPALRLAGGGDGNSYGPVTDGWVLPDDPWLLFDEGRVNRVPLLIGTNADEGTLFVLQAPPVSSEEFEAEVRGLFGAAAGRLLDCYTLERHGDPRRARAAMLGDSTFVAPTRAQVRAVSQSGAPCFLYHFTRVSGAGPARELGAFHAAEIGYVFGRLESGILSRFDATDRRLSATMMDYWVQFARTGDPNRPGLPRWPAYVEEEDVHLELGDEVKPGAWLRAEECDLWDEVAAGWRARLRPGG